MGNIIPTSLASNNGSPKPNAITPYPLIFQPVLLEKIWGGDSLQAVGKAVAKGARVGESWEVADMQATSASGAGGGAIVSRIANGQLQGKSLHDALAMWGAGLIGPTAASKTPATSFPLLVKFLDARENLSVQVHPSPAYAASHRGAHLKTECWFILAAAPGSRIYAGVKEGVTPLEFARAVRSGRAVDLLASHAAVPGLCFNLPSGTVHALGAGVLVAEVQTPSDTTFRLDDWGRVGRELHIEQALKCIEVSPAPTPIQLGDGTQGMVLITEFFTVARMRFAPGQTRMLGLNDRCAIVMTLGGSGMIQLGDDAMEPKTDFKADPCPLALGTSCVIPAAISNRAVFRAHAEGELDVLVATVVP